MKKCNDLLWKYGFGLCLLAALVTLAGVPSSAQTAAPDQITSAFTKNFDLQYTSINRAPSGLNGTQQATLPGIPGIDSVSNFSGAYSAPGFRSNGQP